MLLRCLHVDIVVRVVHTPRLKAGATALPVCTSSHAIHARSETWCNSGSALADATPTQQPCHVSRACPTQHQWYADKDGVITREEMRIGLAHLLIKCPTSRCCYRTSPAAIEPAVAAMAQAGDAVTFCRFRRFFLLLPPDKMVVEYWLRAGDPACCDVRCSTAPYDAQRKPHASPWGHLFAGAMAGAVSRTVTAPFETLRLMAMTGDSAAASGMLAAAAVIVQQRGWRALYRGNGINVARSAPQKAIDFFAFDALKAKLSRVQPNLRGGSAGGTGGSGASAAPPATAAVSRLRLPTGRRQPSGRPAPEGAQTQLGPMATLSAAGLAGVVSTIVLHPLEVLRTRLSTDSGAVYRSMPHALQTVARTEGIPALYRCTGPAGLSMPGASQLCVALRGPLTVPGQAASI